MTKVKLNGFTLLELLIVLILTGILMSLVSGMFYYLFVYQKQVEDKSAPVNTIHRLDYLIRLDMDRAETLSFGSGVLTARLPGDTVSYQFGEESIVRMQRSVTDTFSVAGTVGKLVTREDLLVSFELSLAFGPGTGVRHFYEKQYDQSEFYKYLKP